MTTRTRTKTAVKKKVVAKKVATATVKQKAAKAPIQTHDFGVMNAKLKASLRTGSKLSPVNPSVADTSAWMPNDENLLKALYAKYSEDDFYRWNLDAGRVGRLLNWGYIKHTGGNLDERDCKFRVTKKAVDERISV